MDKTISFLINRHSLLKTLLFWYTLAMEKSIKLKKGKRARKHGFLKRSSSHGGRKTLKKRRTANRKKLTV